MGDTMYAAVAWAKNSPDGVFEQIEIQRNVAGDDDVTFDVKFCGICHTDVHISNNDMVSNQNLDIIIITNYQTFWITTSTLSSSSLPLSS